VSIVKTIGKRQFAFGGEWKSASDDFDDVLDAVKETDGAFFHVISLGKPGRSPSCVGSFTFEGAQKGAIHSFAALVAKAGQDGVYVLPMDDDRLWYVSIRDGLVVSGTDRIEDQENAHNAISTIVALAERNGEVRKVYSPMEIRQSGWAVFDPKELAERSKILPLESASKTSVGAALAAVIAVFVVFGVAGWWFFLKGPSEAEKAAEAAEAARQAYVANLTQQLTNLPSDHAWVNRAYLAVHERANAYIGGYVLTEVRCSPGNCLALYEAPAENAFSPGLMKASIPEGLTFDPTGRAATLNIPLETPYVLVDDNLLRAWPVTPDQTIERIGMLPIYAPNLALTRDPVPEDLSAAAGSAPPGYSPIFRTVVSVRVRNPAPLMAADLASLSDFWANGGFVPTSVQWTLGFNGEQSTWSAEFTRISG